MKKTPQKISARKGLIPILLLLVGVIGMTGYFVYYAKGRINNSPSNTSASMTDEQTTNNTYILKSSNGIDVRFESTVQKDAAQRILVGVINPMIEYYAKENAQIGYVEVGIDELSGQKYGYGFTAYTTNHADPLAIKQSSTFTSVDNPDFRYYPPSL
jgi:hypothetical protein